MLKIQDQRRSLPDPPLPPTPIVVVRTFTPQTPLVSGFKALRVQLSIQFFKSSNSPCICDFRPHFGIIFLLLFKRVGSQTPLVSSFSLCAFDFEFNFSYNSSKTQTALGSAISGPPFGPFFEQCSSMFAQISYHFVLFLAGCFQHSNSPRICDFRPSFWTLFGTVFFKIDAKFLLCGLASCKVLPKLKQP